MISVSKKEDFLKCVSIRKQIKEFGEEQVKALISVGVKKLTISLNITFSDFQLETLCDDLVDVYCHDSIEDVLHVLKNGRQGKYSFGHHSRSVISMGLINDWMTLHLEEKSKLREEEHRIKKIGISEPLVKVDYEAFKNRPKEVKVKKEFNDEDYSLFKSKHIAQKFKPVGEEGEG